MALTQTSPIDRNWVSSSFVSQFFVYLKKICGLFVSEKWERDEKISEIPLLPTISAKVTFQKFVFRKDLNAKMFKVPKSYREDSNRFPDLWLDVPTMDTCRRLSHFLMSLTPECFSKLRPLATELLATDKRCFHCADGHHSKKQKLLLAADGSSSKCIHPTAECNKPRPAVAECTQKSAGCKHEAGPSRSGSHFFDFRSSKPRFNFQSPAFVRRASNSHSHSEIESESDVSCLPGIYMSLDGIGRYNGTDTCLIVFD